ncbi:MAG: Rpn family recombination-promoting nuclease/putative transposase [Chitinophagales bacterium]
MSSIFINPFTDFGFKKLFGEEVNKDLLIDFLNELIPVEKHTIVDLTYLRNEHLSNHEDDRRAVYDLYCENEKGEKFIVEIQRAKQKFFRDRSIYYSTFPIQEQAKTGNKWDFELKAVYTVAIMDFTFEDGRKRQKEEEEEFSFLHTIQLMDIERKSVFYDKLTFIYLEVPKFDKQESELVTHFDKWMYILKNLYRFKKRPKALQERIFQRLFDAAELARFSKKDRMAYEENLKIYRDFLKIYRDFMNVVNTAVEEAVEKTKKESKVEVAAKALEKGFTVEDVSDITGLSLKTIEKIKQKME